jgi:hypothetical protein
MAQFTRQQIGQTLGSLKVGQKLPLPPTFRFRRYTELSEATVIKSRTLHGCVSDSRSLDRGKIDATERWECCAGHLRCPIYSTILGFLSNVSCRSPIPTKRA